MLCRISASFGFGNPFTAHILAYNPPEQTKLQVMIVAIVTCCFARYVINMFADVSSKSHQISMCLAVCQVKQGITTLSSLEVYCIQDNAPLMHPKGDDYRKTNTN